MVLQTKLPICHDVMIIIDTNAIFAKGKDEHAEFLPKRRCDQFFADNSKNIHLGRYYITESVRQEILQQKTELIQGKKDKLAEVCKYFHIDNPDICCDTKNELNIFLKRYHINVLPLPSNQRFPAIMERAFRKKPPFKGGEGESDKGFKDTILWESILEYPYEQERIGRVILITENKNDFNSKFLEDEFLEFHPNIQLNIMNSWEEWELENKNLSVELFASNNISYESVFNLLQERIPKMRKIVSLKEKIKKIDDFVAEVTAKVKLENGSTTETIYYFDVQNNEPMLDYQIASNGEV